MGASPGNVFGTGKNVPRIAMAHRIPYVATASVSNLRDLERKVKYAMGIHGARYIHIFVPCPLGWGSASEDTIRIARLAVEIGQRQPADAALRRRADPRGLHQRVPKPLRVDLQIVHVGNSLFVW